MLLRILYDRESVFCTDQIRELSDSPIASNEVAELVCAVKSRGVPIDVVMNVRLVGMGADDKSMISLPGFV